MVFFEPSEKSGVTGSSWAGSFKSHYIIWFDCVKMGQSSVQIILLFLLLQMLSATTTIHTRMRKTNKVKLRKRCWMEKMALNSYSSRSTFFKFKIWFRWTVQLSTVLLVNDIYQSIHKLILVYWQLWNSDLAFNAASSCKWHLNYRSQISTVLFLP